MRLAKQHIDVGLFTNNLEPMLAFWRDDVGLPFEEMLPMGGGLRQYRHAMNGSVLKINSARDPLDAAPRAGYRDLMIARDGIDAPRALVDPDGNRVTLVPTGHDGVTGIAVNLSVRDEAAFHAFFGTAMELERAADRAYRCGDSLLMFERSDDVAPAYKMQGPGYRYITVQIWDVDAEHAGVVSRGGAEGRPPLTLGSTARISFVRDPDGNWIELSQRASLTGPLPKNV
jgi:lactoylglutathione lyase